MIFRCLVCGGPKPQYWDAAKDAYDWLMVPTMRGYIRPFCSVLCRDTFNGWSTSQRYRVLFGDTRFAAHLFTLLHVGLVIRDTPELGDLLWMLDFPGGVLLSPVPAPTTGLPQGRCPRPTHNSKAWGQNDYCLDCGFRQPSPWRALVAA